MSEGWIRDKAIELKNSGFSKDEAQFILKNFKNKKIKKYAVALNKPDEEVVIMKLDKFN